MSMQSLSDTFSKFASKVALLAGRPYTFVAAASIVIIWALTGPIFSFNETWQLVINTGTTIVTFLMVFLIQNAQNRDSEALQIKLDELLRATDNARDSLIDIESLDQKSLDALRHEFENFDAVVGALANESGKRNKKRGDKAQAKGNKAQ
jgi:low affinity Fe/Cu permease